MESSDEGDQPSAAFYKAGLLVCILVLSCHKPFKIVPSPPKISKDSVLVKLPEKKQVPLKKSKKKKLYLTFDDGPNKGTKNVLHIMQDEQIPVTFFLVGEHVYASTGQHALWDSLQLASQVELCNHSFSHAHNHYEFYYQQPDSVVKDFQRSQDSLGLDNAIVRTPGRNIWRIDSLKFTDLKKSAAAADSLQKAGFIVMGWDLEWHFDPKTMSVTTTADKMIEAIDSTFSHQRTKHPDHLVLLAHDQVYAHSNDSFQLRQFIQLLKKKDDYEILLASGYPGAGKQ
ncbi:MAG TPA: polysaccharide deacetylase family protein [Flavisolibacter sp.]|nr:polysaccharide deacetylase family protein [Flavisolibacter sp.]